MSRRISNYWKHGAAILVLGLAVAGKAAAQGVPCTAGFAGPYPCDNVDLLAFVPTGTLVGGSSGADIWGWTDPETGREYAVQGLSNSVAFVDVTEPTEPVFVGHLPAPATNFLWRDVKVYRNHAYIVGDFSPFSADDDNPDAVHGLQIFDLKQLRGAEAFTEFTETARYLGFDEAHNFVVNEDSGFGYAVASDTCGGGMHMLDLEPDPAAPRFAGCFNDDDLNVHDAQCVIYQGPDAEHRGREICFNANESELDIVDVTNKAAPEVLARVTYEGMSYVHQGWLTEDHSHFALGDETDELDGLTGLDPHNTHTYLFDVSDLDDPVQLPTHVGPTAAIDHNLYIRGRFMYQGNYTAGFRVLDAAGIEEGDLEEIAFFDTHPADNETTFAGAWGSYPFFDSGVVVVSNIEDGLYVLGPHLPAEGGEAGDKATGGGWLAAADGGRIQYGFEAEHAQDGPEGHLKLRDKSAGVRIRIREITTISPVQGACGGIAPSDQALEFRGTGTFNGDDASFRTCVEDNGEPGHSRASDTPDRFHLACLAGCTYSTAERADDETIDAGNIGVRRGEAQADSTDGNAVTLILDPVLLDEAEAGTLQLFEVRAFGPDEQPAANAEITLHRSSGGSLAETLTAVTGDSGTALFSALVTEETGEYRAVTDWAESNQVVVEPILP